MKSTGILLGLAQKLKLVIIMQLIGMRVKMTFHFKHLHLCIEIYFG